MCCDNRLPSDICSGCFYVCVCVFRSREDLSRKRRASFDQYISCAPHFHLFLKTSDCISFLLPAEKKNPCAIENS